MKRCEGPGCEVEFEPKRSTARYHSATCRQRAARDRKAADAQAKAEEAEARGAEHGLVRAVRLELEEAEALDTVAGQLALVLARRIADPDESGVSTLSKALTLQLEAAKTKTDVPVPAHSEPEPAAEEDEVTRARRQREEARQAAGLT